MSRSSGSGSGLPSLSRQISAVSSRSPRALEDRLDLGGAQAHACCAVDLAQVGEEGLAVLVELRPVRLGEGRAGARGSPPGAADPTSISSRRAFSFFLLLVARFLKPLSSSSRAMRSALAWKLRRSGRSTVILWKPKSALSKTLLTTSVLLADHRSVKRPRLAVLEVAVDAGDVADLVRLAVRRLVADLVALVAEALAHLHEEAGARR